MASSEGYVGSGALVRAGSSFRRVENTTRRTQLVSMHLQAGERLGEEIHSDGDQLFFFVSGRGRVVIAGVESRELTAGDVAVVPAGVRHDVVATGDQDLRFWTVYSPPHHPPGTHHETRREADEAERRPRACDVCQKRAAAALCVDCRIARCEPCLAENVFSGKDV